MIYYNNNLIFINPFIKNIIINLFISILLINVVLKKYTIFHISIFYHYNSFEFIFLIVTKLLIINDNEIITNITNYIHYFFSLFGMFLHFIFLEIIELNFCNLSNNIKRNIQDRADSEFNDLMIDNKELKIKLDLDDVASSNYKENIDSGINEKEINE